jgi:hypothetical protein
MVFGEAAPAEVVGFLKNRTLESLRLPAEQLHVSAEGEELILRVMNGKVREYPVRETLFLKLLKWGRLPPSGVRKLSIEMVAGILNDILLSIRSGDVNVRIENGEALSITGRRYSELSDLEVIRTAKPLGIAHITRTDFFLRVYSEIRTTAQILPHDTCGFGFNVFNSETGFQSVSVQHYILRAICSNGAVIRLGGKKEARSHYRQPEGHLQRFLSEQLKPAEESREELVRSLKRSVNSAAPPREDRIYTQLRTLMGSRALQGFIDTLPENPSVYTLFNLVTAHARGLDPGKRLQLEILAGELVMRRN